MSTMPKPTAYGQSLSQLLPTGFAWPRHPQSVQQCWVRGIGATLQELDDFALLTVEQWLPHRTCSRLDEWEEATGLPDPCTAVLTDAADRRRALLLRLQGVELLYADSSSAAPGSIERVMRKLGYDIQVDYDHVFRVERNGVCERLGNNGILNISVANYCEPKPVSDTNGVERRQRECTVDIAVMRCLLATIVSARHAIHVMTEDEVDTCQATIYDPLRVERDGVERDLYVLSHIDM